MLRIQVTFRNYLIIDFSTKAYKFVSSVLNNQYPTLTLKQFAAVKSIAEQHGFEKPIAQ